MELAKEVAEIRLNNQTKTALKPFIGILLGPIVVTGLSTYDLSNVFLSTSAAEKHLSELANDLFGIKVSIDINTASLITSALTGPFDGRFNPARDVREFRLALEMHQGGNFNGGVAKVKGLVNTWRDFAEIDF